MIRINHNYRPRLSLEWQKLKPLELDAAQTVAVPFQEAIELFH